MTERIRVQPSQQTRNGVRVYWGFKEGEFTREEAQAVVEAFQVAMGEKKAAAGNEGG